MLFHDATLRSTRDAEPRHTDPRDPPRAARKYALRSPGAPPLAGFVGRYRGCRTRDAPSGYDLSLTRYANEGWRATFYNSGKEHSPTSATGSAWEPMPWLAVQQAAWEALNKADLRPTSANEDRIVIQTV
jgi:hypothetical protein